MQNKTNLVYDHQIFSISEYGGAARYFLKLIEYMNHQEKWNTELFSGLFMNQFLKKSHIKIKGMYFPRLPKIDTKIRLPINNYFGDIFLKINKPDIIHQTLYSPIKNHNSNFAIIITIHDLIHEKLNYIMRTSVDYEQTAIIKDKANSIYQSNHIICVSESTKKDLLETYDVNTNKISVVHLGTDIDEIEPSNIHHPNPFLLYIGERNGYKNFLRFLDVYVNNEKINEKYNLICFGAGKFNHSEIKLINKYRKFKKKIFHIKGDDKTLASLYLQAVALICPSLYEGFGLPVLEAMRLKCPVICSNIPCFLEITDSNAHFFDPYSKEEINEVITKNIFSKKKLITHVNPAYSQSLKYRWDETGRKTKDIYKKYL